MYRAGLCFCARPHSYVFIPILCILKGVNLTERRTPRRAGRYKWGIPFKIPMVQNVHCTWTLFLCKATWLCFHNTFMSYLSPYVPNFAKICLYYFIVMYRKFRNVPILKSFPPICPYMYFLGMFQG